MRGTGGESFLPPTCRADLQDGEKDEEVGDDDDNEADDFHRTPICGKQPFVNGRVRAGKLQQRREVTEEMIDDIFVAIF